MAPRRTGGFLPARLCKEGRKVLPQEGRGEVLSGRGRRLRKNFLEGKKKEESSSKRGACEDWGNAISFYPPGDQQGQLMMREISPLWGGGGKGGTFFIRGRGQPSNKRRRLYLGEKGVDLLQKEESRSPLRESAQKMRLFRKKREGSTEKILIKEPVLLV